MAERRRLSSLDLLPEEADEFVRSAYAALNEGKTHQADILFELNDKLSTLGIEPISRSAFSRKAVSLHRASARLRDARHLFEGLAPQLTPDRVEDQDRVVAELLKTLIFELAAGDSVTPKATLELCRAWVATLTARRLSAEQRQEAEVKMLKQVEKAIDVVQAKKGGVTAEGRQAMMDALRGGISS